MSTNPPPAGRLIPGVTHTQLLALAARYRPSAPPSPTPAPALVSVDATARQPGYAGSLEVIRAARAYLATIPPAVEGQRGDDRTFYAAGRLVRGFNLTPEQAYPLFAEWNESCVPPWPEAGLRRKLAEADKQPGPRGFLLRSVAIPGRASQANARGGVAGFSGPEGGPTGHPVAGSLAMFGTSGDPGAGAPPPSGFEAASAGTTPAPPAVFCNYVWVNQIIGQTTRRVRQGSRGEQMLATLTAYTGGWPRRCGGMLFVPDGADPWRVRWIRKANELLGWIESVYSPSAGGGGFEWHRGPDLLAPETFLEYCRLHCEAFAFVESYPHEPRVPTHYYHHPDLPDPCPDRSRLAEVVSRFFPATAGDGELIRLMFLSACWGGPPGKRPVFVIESAEGSENGGRGSGKTTLAKMVASLVGGAVSAEQGENIADLKKRLLSPEGMLRFGLIDNVKSLRLSSVGLEALITADTFSGHQMYVGEGRRPNTMQWVITANAPALSKDLAQRSVMVRVTTPTYDPDWQTNLATYIEEHRWEILADCAAELREPNRFPPGYKYTRWPEWQRDVLSKAADPESLARELFGRQLAVDDDIEVVADITEALQKLVKDRGFDPDRDTVLIPSRVLFEEIVQQHGTGNMNETAGLRWLYQIGLKCLRKHSVSTPYRGGVYRPDGQVADGSTADGKFLLWTDRFGISGLPL